MGARAALAALIGLTAVAWAPAPARAADGQVYTFTEASDLTYTVSHWLHTIKGTGHAITGQVTIKGDEIVLPLTLEVPLATFSSDDPRRDRDALIALDAATHPVARLVVRRIEMAWKTLKPGQAGARLDFQGAAIGDLTLRGVTRPVTIPVTGWALPFDAHVTARFAVSLAAHGVPAPRLFFIPVDDRVEIEVEAVARRPGR